MSIGSIFLEIFPFIGQVVQNVEALAGQQPGTSKKSAAVGLVMDGLSIAGAVEGIDPTAVESAVGSAIDAVVAVYNAFGIFKHKSSSAPAATSAPTPAPAPAPAVTAAAPAVAHSAPEAPAAAPEAVHGTRATL